MLIGLLAFYSLSLQAQINNPTPLKNLAQLQQEFINLRFGMFIHYSMATYQNHEWADPQASPSLINPKKLDCNQWTKAANSTNMSFWFYGEACKRVCHAEYKDYGLQHYEQPDKKGCGKRICKCIPEQ